MVDWCVLNCMLLGCPITLRCGACGAWLPLGPANDSDERVQVEIRAATLAARVLDERAAERLTFLSDIGFDGAEIAGWIERQYDSNDAPSEFGELAGYLARCIATHDEDQ